MDEARQRLHLEDLTVGQRFESRSIPLDAAMIAGFAEQYDPQPFHLSEEGGKDSFFGGLAASGWHVASLTMRLLTESVPFAGGVIGAGGDIAWIRPTRPGDALTAVSEILEIVPSRSRSDRGMVTLRTETRNHKGEIVQRLTAKLVVFRRPAAPETGT